MNHFEVLNLFSRYFARPETINIDATISGEKVPFLALFLDLFTARFTNTPTLKFKIRLHNCVFRGCQS